MFAGLGRRSPMAGAGEKMAGDIQDTFPPSVNYSNVAGIRTNYSGEVCHNIYTIYLHIIYKYVYNIYSIYLQYLQTTWSPL